jgi:hypothetical protein
MDESFEPDSKMTAERASHSAKHSHPKYLREEGIRMSESDEQSENAPSSMRDSRDPNPKATHESDRHRQKQHSPTLPTEEGTQIEKSEEQS